MNRRFIVAAALAIGGTLLVAGIVNSVRGPEGKIGPEGQFEGEIRWANVSLIIPPGSPVRVLRNPPLSADHDRYEVRLSIDDGEALLRELVIDAETGEVLADTLSEKYPGEVASILKTMSVNTANRGQWDVPDEWPFVTGPVPAERFDVGSISLIIPTAASGMVVASVENLCDPSSPSCFPKTALVSFGESRAHIDAASGDVVSLEGIAPEHVEAFNRYFASVIKRPEIPAAEQSGE